MIEKVILPVDRIVGGKIRQRRQMAGLSQTALANKLNVTFQQVQKYEKGTNRVSASRLQMLAEALSMPISEFFPDDHSRGEVIPDLAALYPMQDGMKLSQAFLKISDQNVRQNLIKLVEAIADQDDG